MKFFKRIYQNQKGSSAIEFIIVILPCLVLMFLFLNVLMIIGNLMLVQSVANRTVQQVAAYGCLPDRGTNNLKDSIELKTNYLGVRNIQARAYVSDQDWKTDWLSQKQITLNNQGGDNLIDCSSKNRALREKYVYFNIEYEQEVVLIPGISSLNLDAGALTISSNLKR